MDENGYYGHFDTEAEAIAAWNTRAELGSGMLTAEQVREAIMSADRWEKPMGNTGLTNTHLIIRDDGWQAIADELNAELGSGTCENVSDPPEGFLCSACGWGDFAEPSHLLTTAKYAGRVEGGPNYCPNCGRKVVGAC